MASIDTYQVDDRIVLIRTADEHTLLRHGIRGTVQFIDDQGTVFARWDDGSRLGLNVALGDEFRSLTETELAEERAAG